MLCEAWLDHGNVPLQLANGSMRGCRLACGFVGCDLAASSGRGTQRRAVAARKRDVVEVPGLTPQSADAYQDDAVRGPVIITKNGRPSTILMAYEDFVWLSKRDRRVQGGAFKALSPW